jgi:hypothetical protein
MTLQNCKVHSTRSMEKERVNCATEQDDTTHYDSQCLLRKCLNPHFMVQENNCESNCSWTNRDPWLAYEGNSIVDRFSTHLKCTQNNGVKNRSLCFDFSVNTWFTSHLDGLWNRNRPGQSRNVASRTVRQSCNLTHLCLAFRGNGFYQGLFQSLTSVSHHWLVDSHHKNVSHQWLLSTINSYHKSVTRRLFTLEVKLTGLKVEPVDASLSKLPEYNPITGYTSGLQ